MTDLESQVSAARREVSADTISMSVSELTNLYKEGILIIRPEFQRLFRWSTEQKSRLVESILLGIPIPSIFVAQDSGGKWELVDGLQRVSTLLQLQGLLPSSGTPNGPLELTATTYLPDLEGRSWGAAGKRGLSDAQMLDIRLARLDLRVIKRSSDPKAKFDLFQRLNSYGSTLTPQEIRTALIAGVNSDVLTWIHKLSQHESFVQSLSLGDRLLDEQFDLELVLRFLMLHNRELKGKRGGLGDFPTKLDNWVIDFAEKFPAGAKLLESTFMQTFDAIDQAGSESVFRKWDDGKNSFRGGFSSTSFECIALGIAFHVANGSSFRDDVIGAAKELWSKIIPEELGTVTGLATGDRFAKTIPIGRKLMSRK
ncbi:hypothetical protein CH305_11205 [Rhodococcus sp. 15-649-2-2]|uniref:DUF262 domain-containing protein n=1 Tax=Rhodococcus sp. 15-649-2-2 TaxID=2023140 RepID=UPI000B9C6E5C|nr:DUF262 domain-containing protein [Rhodococcus sp. 15-649-2-2]OZE81115.1 hypothetical protein CH305_11205 [Rhodococcus sp. 15-649-2-2]